ncbi:SDR family NAD(P)-dependent oxidoreductase [Sediminibacterium sp. TEGAF015]|uniref:SDR family NAD(P)-dependent oxidoreductase n=1 Tax=Sediminibacterium sp. TEGAF015 TaxID=575378 RepID=UPI002207D1C2|nr:SDR family oxidoreductase [Sediminibacterium sp. TEGAF015]BDQ13355.1 oxidoreductase [Sediminibacterium sp. TEGAF015]
MIEQLVILITGSRKGIGRELSEYFLSLGHQVIGCSRSENDLEHINYKHYCLDVADEGAVKNIFSAIRKNFGKLDVLINNAGVASMNHLLLTPGSTVDKLFQTNFKGTFLFSREAAKLMQKNRFGRIVNFSTVAVALDLEGEAIYAASKNAVEQLTRVMAKEFGGLGITVNCVGPTPIDTDLIKAVPKNKIEELIAHQAVRRMGTFGDVINVIDFFISPKSDFISGQTIYLGGVFK